MKIFYSTLLLILNKLGLNLINRRLFHFCYFIIYHKFFCKRYPEDLFDNGYTELKEKFHLKDIDLDKYLNYENFNFVSNGKKINLIDLKKIYSVMNNIGVISIIKNYLGNKIYCYDNSNKTLGNQKSTDSSWQPHHDIKGRRLKIYIWLNEKNMNTHPLYYLRKTHKDIISWQKYEDTRFPNIELNKFDKIYGEKGSIIIFDTHGIHSHFKTTTVLRSVIELTFEPYGIFHRLNKKNINKEIARLDLIKLSQLLQ